ncbi:MAG: TldD/PmbA family protein [Actinomycetota bacterium]|nr:TldD/PmbA family protein [Actinomycetota bacterium]
MSGLDLAEQALRAADGDEAEVLVHAERSGVARFAGSVVHQPTLIDNAVVRVRIVRDGKVGRAATNRVDADGLAAVARRAADAADSARPDPDFPGLAPPAEYPELPGYDEETAELGAEDQARLAATAIEAAPEFGLYGYFTSGVTEIALASAAGLQAHQEVTDAVCICLAAAEGASGWDEQTHWRVSAVDPAVAAQRAAQIAGRTSGAQELEPGTYCAVLGPYAVAELLRWFSYDSLGAQGFLEERSYFCGRIGELAFDEKVSITDDALDDDNLPKRFDFEGTPKQRVELVEKGVIRDVVWDRPSAARAGNGRVSTGHAPPDAWRFYGPLPTAFALGPGDVGSMDELAALVGDGIYVNRLHYLSVVDPREGVLTGMTRDGTFRVGGGKVTEPLVNLRFTVSVPDVLREVPGLARERKLVNLNDLYDERFPYAALVPALATAHFHISGTGSGPGL